jgi:hypothetical protein
MKTHFSLPRIRIIGFVFLIMTVFTFLAWASEETGCPKYGPKENPIAIPLSQSFDYFRHPENRAPDFWRLIPYYESQFNGGACSVASVAMIVNGFLRAGHGYCLKDQDTNVSQLVLIQNENQHQWKGKLTQEGFKGKLGLTLESLDRAVKASLITFGMRGVQTKMVQTDKNSPEALLEFRNALELNEKNSDDFILVHFLQDVLTRSPGGPYPHISPIGAYDIKHKKVLILDVDRKWYEPYWVPDYMLFEAMVAKTRTFGHGGYIRIWKP